MADHLPGRHHLALDQVVCQIQHTAEQQFVAGDALGHEGITVCGRRRVFQNEPTFGADRHDHRVFDLLGFDKAQNFGTKIFAPV